MGSLASSGDVLVQHKFSLFYSNYYNTNLPPVHLIYLPGDSTNLFIDRSLIAREEAIKLLKFHLLRAQNRMSQQANKHRTNTQFAIGDYVFLRLQPYRQFTLGKQAFHKLNPKFYGPYKVTDRIGRVAYQLELPSLANIHNVFHVSQLKPCTELASTVIHHPNVPSVAPLRGDPESIFAKKMVKRGRIAATNVLVK